MIRYINCLFVDEDYEKREFRSNDQEMSMYGLRWDGAATRKVQLIVFCGLSFWNLTTKV